MVRTLKHYSNIPFFGKNEEQGLRKQEYLGEFYQDKSIWSIWSLNSKRAPQDAERVVGFTGVNRSPGLSSQHRKLPQTSHSNFMCQVPHRNSLEDVRGTETPMNYQGSSLHMNKQMHLFGSFETFSKLASRNFVQLPFLPPVHDTVSFQTICPQWV